MANPEHLSLLKQSVADWNQWRTDNPDIQPDLRYANLREADLAGADLRGAQLHAANFDHAYLVEADLSGTKLRDVFLDEANLGGANLRGVDLGGVYIRRAFLREANLDAANLHGTILTDADLIGATLRETVLREARLIGARLNGATLTQADLREVDLRTGDLRAATITMADLRKADLGDTNFRGADLAGSNFTEANLIGSNLTVANLCGTNLRGADLRGADLSESNLSEADLAEANLERSILVNTICNKAIFTGCRIHGISAWDVRLDDAQQTNLFITPAGEPDITVDNLEVAQFIYLLLNNSRIREVIDTITSKVVLVLGRFTPERKVVLDAIRERLRTKNYSPVIFDFEKPITRDLTETVMTLAGMARFVIADITDAKSIPQELMAIVPHLPSVAVQPLLLASQQEYGMFEHFKRFPWVLDTVLYHDQETLLRSLESTVIFPAEQKAKELIATQRK